MRKLVLSALILASALQTALGDWYGGNLEYSVSNGEVTIQKYWKAWNWNLQTSPYSIPNTIDGCPVTKIGNNAYQEAYDLSGVIIPDNVTSIGASAFNGCYNLKSVSLGNNLTTIGEAAFTGTKISTISFPTSLTTIGTHAFSGINTFKSVRIPRNAEVQDYAFQSCQNLVVVVPPEVSYTPYSFYLVKSVVYITSDLINELTYELTNDPSFINTLANNDAFVTAVANKIKATGGNYGLATQSGLSSAIEPLATKSELTSLATKSEITTAINEGRAAGIASVTASPNTWSLFTASQIQNMAVGDLVLTRQASGGFVLNYDIEQSTDLLNWTRYQALSLPLTGLPTDKAFVRIKAKGETNFTRSLVGNYPNTVTGDGIAMNTSSVNETLYYNDNDPVGLGATMAIYVGGIIKAFVTFGGNRTGQPFGFSLTPSGPTQYVGVFTDGNVNF